jgi:ElaB/YqjD/DUF883 family membrane-anchored ribosome-binding protein
MTTQHIDPDAVDLSFLRQEFNRFRAELAGAQDKLGGGASAALDQISAYLNGGGLSSRLASLESELEHLADKLKGGGKDAVIRLEKEVEHRPITSIAIAFGVGLLAAQFFRRS